MCQKVYTGWNWLWDQAVILWYDNGLHQAGFFLWGTLFVTLVLLFILAYRLFWKPAQINEWLVTLWEKKVMPSLPFYLLVAAGVSVFALMAIPWTQACWVKQDLKLSASKLRQSVEPQFPQLFPKPPIVENFDATRDIEKVAWEVENEARKTVAQILAGLAAMLAFYFAWRRNQLTEKGHEIDRQGQITDRFTKAVEQLGNENMAQRLGGIYALERISQDSERDYWPVMEVLCAFVREKSQQREAAKPLDEAAKAFTTWIKEPEEKEDKSVAPSSGEETPAKGPEEMPRLAEDLQAAVTVIGRRGRVEWEKENGKRIDFTGAILRGVIFKKAELAGAIFSGAEMQSANFKEACLQSAELVSTNVQGAIFDNAQMQNAYFKETQLQGVSFFNTRLQLTRFENSCGPGTDFSGALLQFAQFLHSQLRGSILNGARLQGARFLDTHLQGSSFLDADLQGTEFFGTDLQGAIFALTRLQGARFGGLQQHNAIPYSMNLKRSNLNGSNLNNAYLLGAQIIDCQIDGILIENLNTSDKDKTDWERIIRDAGEFNGIDAFKHFMANTINHVAHAQENRHPLPQMKSDSDRFVSLNKELALTDSYVAEVYLKMWPYSDSFSIPYYNQIRSHIRFVLNADKNHPVRKELEARGLGDLLKEPETPKPTDGAGAGPAPAGVA